MISTFKLLIAMTFIACFHSLSAQNEKAAFSKETHKLYFYQFEGQLSPETIEALQNEILVMQFVTEVKIEYKAEKKAGQVRLLATEKFASVDADFDFSIYNLKQLLLRYNLIPNECKSVLVTR